MAGIAGINRGFYSTLDFLLPDVITPQFVQDKIDAAKRTNEDIQEKVRRYNYERGGKIGGAIGDLYQSALGMIPQAVIAVMSGGTSAAAQGGSTLAGAADDIVSNITRQLTKNAGYMLSLIHISIYFGMLFCNTFNWSGCAGFKIPVDCNMSYRHFIEGKSTGFIRTNDSGVAKSFYCG